VVVVVGGGGSGGRWCLVNAKKTSRGDGFNTPPIEKKSVSEIGHTA